MKLIFLALIAQTCLVLTQKMNKIERVKQQSIQNVVTIKTNDPFYKFLKVPFYKEILACFCPCIIFAHYCKKTGVFCLNSPS